jgi:dihydropyrimidinase
MQILLRGGTVVTADGRSLSDVLVDGERISEVGPLLRAPAAQEIDATGCYVLPGGVDVHTHLDMLVDGIRTADDFESGTRAAAWGGTTTVIDYAAQWKGGTLHEAFEAWMARADGRAVIDFGFHMSIADLRPDVEDEIDEMVRLGVPSFKVFMAYPGRLMLDDGAIFKVLRRTAANGGLVCLHAENGPVIQALVEEALRDGHVAPAFHALTRPALLEAEAIRRGIALAELAGGRLYVVHLSSDLGLDAVREARRRGLPVLAETCPQYLYLSEKRYQAPPLEASKYVMSPPLRAPGARDALWQGLADGDVDVVGTDHCPFRLADKARGEEDFSRIPNGAPGIEPRMLLVYQAVVHNRLTLERFVDVTATTPARVFGLGPVKGTVEPGADADLVVLDPAGQTTVSAASHHMRVDYTPYEGMVLAGAIRTVLARGTILLHGGKFSATPGRGRYLPRAAAVS